MFYYFCFQFYFWAKDTNTVPYWYMKAFLKESSHQIWFFRRFSMDRVYYWGYLSWTFNILKNHRYPLISNGPAKFLSNPLSCVDTSRSPTVVKVAQDGVGWWVVLLFHHVQNVSWFLLLSLKSWECYTEIICNPVTSPAITGTGQSKYSIFWLVKRGTM